MVHWWDTLEGEGLEGASLQEQDWETPGSGHRPLCPPPDTMWGGAGRLGLIQGDAVTMDTVKLLLELSLSGKTWVLPQLWCRRWGPSIDMGR